MTDHHPDIDEICNVLNCTPDQAPEQVRELADRLAQERYKNQWTRACLGSAQLTMKSIDLVKDSPVGSKREFKARRTLHKIWQRHWRRVSKYNKLFGKNLYVPVWYVAEMERGE